MKGINDIELEFLRESNAIEREYSKEALDGAVSAWRYVRDRKKMTPEVVKETHRILMDSRPLLSHYKGEFRDIPIWVGGREGYNHWHVPAAIDQWCKVMNAPERGEWDDTDREIRSKALHVEYEHVHPFADGNGRTGRMFMNWWRLKHGLPILVIHEGKEQFDYYDWFN